MASNEPRYLTKSRFKLACECGTKLFYTKKTEEYGDSKIEDSFLAALADGGFQVGELAKQYFPGGIGITSLGYDEALAETHEVLQFGALAIFEAAVQYKELLIRADILEFKGNDINLFEVKAKSFDSQEDDPLFNKNGTISRKWREYLLDIAFQTYVVEKAFPGRRIVPYLYLVDKSSRSPISGLNQRFILKKDKKGRTTVEVPVPLTENELFPSLLVKVRVGDAVKHIYHDERERIHEDKSFEESIWFFAEHYQKDQIIPPVLGTKCLKCEFSGGDKTKSGRDECFQQVLPTNQLVPIEKSVLSIWNFRGKEKCLQAGKFRLQDIEEADIAPKGHDKEGLSASERQWLQVVKSQREDKSPYIDTANLRHEISRLTFPLHFIDFETAQVAIPFNQGRRPYEGLAFQFSHHTLSASGRLTHETEFLLAERGVFPNYQFLRALKKALTNDSGSIFRYASHENTYMNLLYSQLLEEEESDKEELLEFIRLISHSKDDSVEQWQGARDMIDLCTWVKQYFYAPETQGSNSIKKVLPAVLNQSDFLKAKYGRPVYGSDEIHSTNFSHFTWIQEEAGQIQDPYSLLPAIFPESSKNDNQYLLYSSEELKDGGAALTAYAKLQFTEMTARERSALSNALRKYCELDTLAMAMIFEAFREWSKEA